VVSRRGLLALGAAALLPRSAVSQEGQVPALRFSALSAGAPLPSWLEPITFGGKARPTQYALVEDEGRVVLQARAESSASGLARTLRVDPARLPFLSWRWKTRRLLERSNIATKDGDDFPLRLYVTFDLDPATLPFGERLQISLGRAVWGDRLPVAALCYVWDNRAPPDTIAPNAYTGRVRMVVADSGAASLGRWVSHRRNVAEDYRRAFGGKVPEVASIIVSVDTDNTSDSAESWFGDIEFNSS
jgi:hypothetical protein